MRRFARRVPTGGHVFTCSGKCGTCVCGHNTCKHRRACVPGLGWMLVCDGDGLPCDCSRDVAVAR